MYIALSSTEEFIAMAKTVEQLENYIDKYNFHAVDIFRFEFGTETISLTTLYNNYIKTIE
nr:MAG TPA: hypothetical protein [Caudoviricetes sp.]